MTDPSGLRNFSPVDRSGCDYYKKRCEECSDKYACKADDCCRAFSDSLTDSLIRGCLIEFNKRNCENIADERLKKVCIGQAHFDCYWRSNGDWHGMSRSLPNGLPSECADAVDYIGGMNPTIMYLR